MTEKNFTDYTKIIEALLFVSPRPIQTKTIGEILDISEDCIKEILKKMQEDFRERGINIRKVAEGIEMCTNPSLHCYIEKLQNYTSSSLSKASLETLAIIAYNQPVTRAEIEEIRGVKTAKILSSLLEAKLIRISGKSDKPGKPFVYCTTRDFLRHFGIKSLDELPSIIKI
ncbi:MAG TPA: SMC-Scp complex subunit ScpB [Candidatus Eremiobacteraeota bacterium]|nr:MAG: hypothetical protein BWY64_00183 [bacterium ADurb.Bin363]HPZ07356.1 SMC-Scp complex subunit ScpB [Candidatus Eremiobacteraeota bacterium]